MVLAKHELIEALRLRYDHYSAQSVFELARERANLADKAAYEGAELRAWRDGLAAVGDRVGRVLDHLDALLANDTHAAVKPAATHEPAVKHEPTAKHEPAVKHDAVKHEPAAKHEPAVKPATIETTIVLTGVELADGEQVLVCGDTTALGDWDPAHARLLDRAGSAWTTVVTIATTAPLSFKFLRRGADGQITWEAGDNRSLPAAPRVEAMWR